MHIYDLCACMIYNSCASCREILLLIQSCSYWKEIFIHFHFVKFLVKGLVLGSYHLHVFTSLKSNYLQVYVVLHVKFIVLFDLILDANDRPSIVGGLKYSTSLLEKLYKCPLMLLVL